MALPMFLRASITHGIQVEVATTNDDGFGKVLNVPIGEKVDWNGFPHYFFSKQLEVYKVSFSLRNWLSKNIKRYDLVHIHSLFSFASTCAGLTAKSGGIPYIIRPLGVLNQWGVTNRRPILKKLSLKLFEGPLINGAAALHFTSQQEAVEAGKVCTPRKTFIIPIPFEADPASSIVTNSVPVRDGIKTILFLSRLDPKKGLELLIRSFSVVQKKHKNLLLLIAGTGHDAYIAKLKSISQELKVEDSIRWAGFLEGKSKADAFSQADIFVLPSYSENFGIAGVEAMAAGVPTILTNGIGIAEAAKRSNAAIIVEPACEELASAMELLLTKHDLAASLRDNGPRFVRQYYSVAAVGSQLKSEYLDILNK